MSECSKSEEKGNIPQFLKIVLAVGLFLVLAGILFLFMFSFDANVKKTVFMPLLIVGLSACLLYYSLVNSKGGGIFSLSLFLFASGLFFLLQDLELISYTLSEGWPILVIIGGVSILLGGLRTKKRRFCYLIPAIIIIILGFGFLLFSTDVIALPFIAFLGRWWPLFFVVGVLGLVVLFFLWKNNNPFKDSAEDLDDDFSDINTED
ncbi:MAG: hypothetical protein J6B32_01450 [Spirochaetaceae bacterium]|nr:hypothetical protein [Spirochaetaceae bacterium]